MPVHWDSALLSAFWGSMVVSRLVQTRAALSLSLNPVLVYMENHYRSRKWPCSITVRPSSRLIAMIKLQPGISTKNLLMQLTVMLCGCFASTVPLFLVRARSRILSSNVSPRTRSARAGRLICLERRTPTVTPVLADDIMGGGSRRTSRAPASPIS